MNMINFLHCEIATKNKNKRTNLFVLNKYDMIGMCPHMQRKSGVVHTKVEYGILFSCLNNLPKERLVHC
jgi:hypothetical protein